MKQMNQATWKRIAEYYDSYTNFLGKRLNVWSTWHDSDFHPPDSYLDFVSGTHFHPTGEKEYWGWKSEI